MTLGQGIKSIRKRLGETLVQFSDRLGTDNSVVSRYERDLVTPNRSMLLLISQFAETQAEKSAIAQALGSEIDEAGKKFLADSDALLEAMELDDLTRSRFREVVGRLIRSGDIDRSIVRFLEIFERNSSVAARTLIEDWVWSLEHRVAVVSHQSNVDPAEEQFLQRAREFYRTADENERHEVESLMMSTRPVKTKGKLADVG